MRLQIIEFFKQNGVHYEEQSNQFLIDCPKCGKESHTYMGQDNGIWDCKICGEKGNFYGYKKYFTTEVVQTKEALSENTVQAFIKNLNGNKYNLQYLSKRGLTKRVIESERIGCNNNGDIAIPFYENGKLVAIKFRNMNFENQMQKYEENKIEGVEGKKPNKWYSIGKPGLYGKAEGKEVLLCEGEWDRLAALSYGIRDVVSAPGCTTTNWVEGLRGVETVYVCYDSDGPGRKGAYEIASRLGLDRCKNVELPLKDLNDCLLGGITYAQIKKIILQASPFPVPGMCTADRFRSEVLYEMGHLHELRGVATGHERLDQLTRGFKGGQIRLVSGFTSAGKSTWIMNEMLLYALQRIPVTIFSFESDTTDVVMNMVQYLSSKPLDELTVEQKNAALDKLDSLPLHFFDEKNFTEVLNIVKFKELCKQNRDRFGSKFFVLDNIQFLLNFDHSKRSFDEKVTELMTELKAMAKTLDIHIIAIAGLNRAAYGVPDKNGIRSLKKPQINDIKGSSGFEQTADYVMFIHRDTGFDAPDEIKTSVEVIIAKNRPGRGITGIIPFRYDVNTCRYTEDHL